MPEPKTLLQLAGANLEPASLGNACVLLIDFQDEYLDGPIAVGNAGAAIENARKLLAQARKAGSPIIHIAHKGRPGGLFDRDAERGRIVKDLAPEAGEKTVEKGLPNAFANTELHSLIEKTGREELVIAGFMTHMCVSSTARAALDLGYRVTIDASSCGTRDLPDGKGGVVRAEQLNEAALVALSDRFAVVARDHEWK